MIVKLIIGALIGGTLICTPNVASAGWQWTDWGMTKSEVEKAASQNGSTLTEASQSKPSQIELDTRYITLNLPFRARLIFNETGQLTIVVLVQTAGNQCGFILSAMKSSYGNPYDTSGNPEYSTWSWRDEKARNDVIFRLVGPANYPQRWCDIQYSALANHRDLGL